MLPLPLITRTYYPRSSSLRNLKLRQHGSSTWSKQRFAELHQVPALGVSQSIFIMVLTSALLRAYDHTEFLAGLPCSGPMRGKPGAPGASCGER